MGKKSDFFWSRVVAYKRCTTYVGISVVRVVGVALGSEEAWKFGGRERERKRLSCSLEGIEINCLVFLTSIRASTPSSLVFAVLAHAKYRCSVSCAFTAGIQKASVFSLETAAGRLDLTSCLVLARNSRLYSVEE